jgi:hypothetical protein
MNNDVAAMATSSVKIVRGRNRIPTKHDDGNVLLQKNLCLPTTKSPSNFQVPSNKYSSKKTSKMKLLPTLQLQVFNKQRDSFSLTACTLDRTTSKSSAPSQEDFNAPIINGSFLLQV